MAAEFDAYHKWLAIPPAEQPPNFYRLLALDPFERDPDVIESAADARMVHLRSLQFGQHAELTQKLLNEIAAARLCLLKPDKKAAYDASLREQIQRRRNALIPPPLTAAPSNPPGAIQAEPEGRNLLDFIDAAYQSPLAGAPADPRRSTQAGTGTFANRGAAARGKKGAWSRWLFVLAPLLGIGGVVAAIAYRNSRDATDPTTASNVDLAQSGSIERPPAQRVAATSASGRRPSATPKPALAVRPVDGSNIAKLASSPLQTHGSPAQTGAPAVAQPITRPIARPPIANKPETSSPPATPAMQTVAPSRQVESSGASASARSATSNARLEYRCMETKPDTNQIRCYFRIANDGAAPLPLADLKVRYWYARSGDRPRNFWCDYAAVNKDNVAGRFVVVDRPTEKAAGYLELSFAPGAGEIKPGENSGEIQCRFAADDWSNIDQTKDFSFDPAAAQWATNPRAALYQNGKLVSGQEPRRGR